MQGGPSVLVLRVRVGAGVEQGGDGREVVGLDGMVQRGFDGVEQGEVVRGFVVLGGGGGVSGQSER